MACDLGEEAQVTRYVNDAGRALGGIDVLINNASGIGMKDDESGWLASVNIDLFATARATRAAIPFLEKSKGSIINISSISGLKAVPRFRMPRSKRHSSTTPWGRAWRSRESRSG
jgi:3-oxoacyl-[acyl-carrier protein] reductase